MVKSSSSKETSGRHMSDHLRNFIQSKVNSFIKWDLIRFFHDNPHTKDTAENIARYTGRDIWTIERELNGLATAEVLQQEQISNIMVYALADDPMIRETISEFIEACHDRQFRVEAIHQVIKGMQFSPRHDF